MNTHAIRNAPDHELARSPAAARIGRLAAQSHLFLTHFEYRHHLTPPDHWAPPDRPDLFTRPHWHAGHLVEPKYGPFRHDSPLGSFHPGHRAKWTAHELCHRLVGYAWRPDAPPLWHALSARLAELLPVIVYYHLDEAGLRRCPDHHAPLYDHHCPACERAAALGPADHIDDRWHRSARDHLDAELTAIHRSLRLGRPVPHRHHTLDLMSDALAYTAAHHRRLTSPTFARFQERFPTPDRTHPTLDALEDRTRALFAHLTDATPIDPLTPRDWATHDIAWRLLTLGQHSEPEITTALDRIVDHLADHPHDHQHAIDAYTALHADFIIPDPDDIFATGYPLPDGHGYATAQAIDGLTQTLPATTELLADALHPVVDHFVRHDPPARLPIARRFAAFLATEPGPLADLAAYEAALAHPAPPDAALDSLAFTAPDDAPLCPADGLEVLDLAYDARALAATLDTDPDAIPEDLDHIPPRPHTLALRRTAGGDLIVAEISTAARDLLRALADTPRAAAAIDLPPAELESLRALALVAPTRWRT